MAIATTPVTFNATMDGIGNFVVASALVGSVVPEAANVINGKVYTYYAQSVDGSQWESGSGTYTVSTHTLARTTIAANSDGSAVVLNFATVPIVSVFSSSSPHLEPVSSIATLTGDFTLGSGLTNSGNVLKTSAGQMPGTTTNDNASAGNVGEYIESVILIGSSVSVSSGVSHDVTSISLTAGDWDVTGIVISNPAGGAVQTQLFAWVNVISATLPAGPSGGLYGIQTTFSTNAGVYAPVGTFRFSLSSTTTIFLSGLVTWTTGTNSFYGTVKARRKR